MEAECSGGRRYTWRRRDLTAKEMGKMMHGLFLESIFIYQFASNLVYITLQFHACILMVIKMLSFLLI